MLSSQRLADPIATLPRVCTMAVVAMVVTATHAPTLALAQGDVPVMVGGEPDLDACNTSGEVVGLNPEGDNFLSVRSGPGSRYREIDRLGPRDDVILCDKRDPWIGVVYGRASCGVSSPIDVKGPYRGPCKSGWVFGKYIRETAG